MQKHRSLPHNPDIANTFFRAGFIESWGRGIEKICNLCKEYGIAERLMDIYSFHHKFQTKEFIDRCNQVWSD